MTTQWLIEDVINRSNVRQLQNTLSDLNGKYAVKHILKILLEVDDYKTDEWINKSIGDAAMTGKFRFESNTKTFVFSW